MFLLFLKKESNKKLTLYHAHFQRSARGSQGCAAELVQWDSTFAVENHSRHEFSTFKGR
jgi:hypothetical protein